MPSPNIIASVLARDTKDVAIVLLGNSIVLYNPPLRVAEEIGMLDCISGGRAVAGFPVGSSMDTNYCYGQNPVTIREKYHEAEDLIIKAWTEEGTFSYSGKHNQLGEQTTGSCRPTPTPARTRRCSPPRVTLVADAGHMVVLERPVETAAAVLAHLEVSEELAATA